MGTSVATELMARDIEGRLEMEMARVLLFNGSIVLERSSPTPAQRILRSPLAPLAARLSSRRVFRHQFGSIFSAAHPLSAEEADDQWSLTCDNGGRTLGAQAIDYLDERTSRPPAGTGRSATGRRRSASPGGCSTRLRRPTCSTPCASFGLECRSPSCPSSVTIPNSKTRNE